MGPGFHLQPERNQKTITPFSDYLVRAGWCFLVTGWIPADDEDNCCSAKLFLFSSARSALRRTTYDSIRAVVWSLFSRLSLRWRIPRSLFFNRFTRPVFASLRLLSFLLWDLLFIGSPLRTYIFPRIFQRLSVAGTIFLYFSLFQSPYQNGNVKKGGGAPFLIFYIN